VAAESCLEAGVAAKAALALSAQGSDWLDDRGLPGRFRAPSRTFVNRAWKRAHSNFLGGLYPPLRHAVEDEGVPVNTRGR